MAQQFVNKLKEAPNGELKSSLKPISIGNRKLGGRRRGYNGVFDEMSIRVFGHMNVEVNRSIV